MTNTKNLLAVKAAAKAQIGQGKFGQVYEKSPGLVVKKINKQMDKDLLNEINLQAKAAELGLAPQIHEVNLNIPKQVIDNTKNLNLNKNYGAAEITMEDLRKNYAPLSVSQDLTRALNLQPNPELTPLQYAQASIGTAQQIAQLALNNISLNDRHGQNIFVNKMTSRPIQIDFGSAKPITNTREQASVIANAVKQGFHAANLPEEASIFKGIIDDLIYSDPQAALDIAKQGLSRLQKIKTPIDPSSYKYATVNRAEDFIAR
jgi:hypothetical protein